MGDSNWEEIISVLNQGGYCEDIAIEGYHDPIYCGDKAFEGQVLALNYLKDCRKRVNKYV